MIKELSESYNLTQRAIFDLKTIIHSVLLEHKDRLSNAEIVRTLGIYQGYSGQHEGHISKVLLELMKAEGILYQDKKSKK